MTIQYSEFRRQIMKLTDEQLQALEHNVVNELDRNWDYLQNEDPTDFNCKADIKELNKKRQRILWENERRNNLRNAKLLKKQEQSEKATLQLFNPESQKERELQHLHDEWKETIIESKENIKQLRNKINVIFSETTPQLKEAENNYRIHLKEVEQQYKDYCIKIKNDKDNYITLLKTNALNKVKNIKDEINNWETKLLESRSKWKTLKTQIETMKKNKEQI